MVLNLPNPLLCPHIPACKDDIFEGAQVESMLEAVLGGYHGTIVSETDDCVMKRVMKQGVTQCAHCTIHIGEHSMLEAICHSLVPCPLTCVFVQRATSLPGPSFYYSVLSLLMLVPKPPVIRCQSTRTLLIIDANCSSVTLPNPLWPPSHHTACAVSLSTQVCIRPDG